MNTEEMLSYLNTRIDDIAEKREDYVQMANKWDKMFRLDLWTETKAEARAEGREQVTDTTPLNVAHLTERLIDTSPDISVPPREMTLDAQKTADAIGRWLMAAWRRMNNDANTNVVGDAWWMAAVRGRSVFQLMWIQDKLPPFQRKQRLPFMVRVLDPRDCGFDSNGVYTELCYHVSTITRAQAKVQFPDVTFPNKTVRGKSVPDEEVETFVKDVWWIDRDTGKVWNAIIVDEEFGVEPFETKYPDLPMIEFAFDRQPHNEEGHKTYSILRSLEETWPMMSTILSQIATGMWWYFWPPIIVQNEMGEAIDDLEVGPGKTTYAPMGTSINKLDISPNIPLAENLLQHMNTLSQEGTFTKILYGDAGNLQAGFAVSNLRNSAEGRIGKGIQQLQWAIEKVCGLILSMIEEFQPDGVKVQGYDDRQAGAYWETITAEMIDGAYQCEVLVSHRIPADEVQKVTMGSRLKQDGVISSETVRKSFVPMKLPVDEGERVVLEQLMMEPQYKQMLGNAVMSKHFGERWQEIATSAMALQAQMIQQAQQLQAMQQAGAMPPGPPELARPGSPMPPPEAGMPGGPGAINPAALGQGQFSPQQEGQLTEDVLGLGAGPNIPPEVYQMLANGNRGNQNG